MASEGGSGINDDVGEDAYTFPGGGTEDDLFGGQVPAAQDEQEDDEEYEDADEAAEEDEAEGDQTGTGSSWEHVPGEQTSGEASASAGEPPQDA